MRKYLNSSMRHASTFVLLLTSSSAFAASYEAPLNVHGDPDLQGLWTSATITTLNRPAQFDDLVLTPEQAAASENAMGEQMAAIDNPPDPSEGGDVGGYNLFLDGSGYARLTRRRRNPQQHIGLSRRWAAPHAVGRKSKVRTVLFTRTRCF